MKLSSFLLTSLVAGAGFMATGAGAQTIERTAPLATVDDGVGGFNAYFGDTFAASTQNRAFSDLFTFNVDTPFDAAGSLTSSYLNVPQTKDLNITSMSLYRYDPVTLDVLGTAISGIDGSGTGANATDSWSLSGFNLTEGYYALRVDGNVSGAGGGAFGGDLNISPVPEPQSWAMLLGGLGLAGMLARRRKP